MFKRLFVFCLVCLVCGCGQTIRLLPTNRDFVESKTAPTHEVSKTKTAMLLPLTGSRAIVGENFQNAALMSGLERSVETTEVLFFDTKGTPEGTTEAYRQAMLESPDVVLGPVFASEVKAVRAENPAQPVISFTSDSAVLGDNIYSLALLIPQQINRVVEYACMHGQRRIALIGPQDKTGEIVIQAFETAVQSCPGMQITKISLYQPNATDLTTPVQRIAPPLIDARSKNLTEQEKELLRNPSAERLSFDALFIFESGVKLEQLVSILYYYDVTPQIVPFYGLATLRQTRIDQLTGAYFADIPQYRIEMFKRNYQDAFGKTPLPIASFGYDAVSLVSFLSQENVLDESALIDPIGYNGMNGRFRLNPDGTNDRLLDMFQLQGKGRAVVVEQAPAEFNTQN